MSILVMDDLLLLINPRFGFNDCILYAVCNCVVLSADERGPLTQSYIPGY